MNSKKKWEIYFKFTTSCGIKCPACQNILHPSLFEKHKKICQESIADKFDPLDIVKDSENEENGIPGFFDDFKLKYHDFYVNIHVFKKWNII